jgi:C-terminal processing protease CtpA/Prc
MASRTTNYQLPTTNYQTSSSKPRSRAASTVRTSMAFLAIGCASVISFAYGHSLKNTAIIPALKDTSNSAAAADLSPNLKDIYARLQRDYDGTITAQDLDTSLKKGVAQSAKDPYTVYFSPEEAKSFTSSLNGKFIVIFAELGNCGEQ